MITNKKEKYQIRSIKNNIAFISFKPNGYINEASEDFLNAMGYSLSEVVNKHHRIFCSSSLVNSSEYQNFWNELNKGKKQQGKMLRFDKYGNKVWIEATYFPVIRNNKVVEVIKIATDVTKSHEESLSKEAILTFIQRF